MDPIREFKLRMIAAMVKRLEDQLLYGADITPPPWPSRDQAIKAANELVLKEVWDAHGD